MIGPFLCSSVSADLQEVLFVCGFPILSLNSARDIASAISVCSLSRARNEAIPFFSCHLYLPELEFLNLSQSASHFTAFQEKSIAS